MGVVSSAGAESTRRSGMSGDGDNRWANSVDGFASGDIGRGTEVASEELLAFAFAWRVGSCDWGCLLEEETSPASCSRDISRIPRLRPDSKSLNEGWFECSGEGNASMSCGVGSSTGRGAGGLVTEMVGRLDGCSRDLLVTLSRAEGTGTGIGSLASARTGMGTEASESDVRSRTPRPTFSVVCK